MTEETRPASRSESVPIPPEELNEILSEINAMWSTLVMVARNAPGGAEVLKTRGDLPGIVEQVFKQAALAAAVPRPEPVAWRYRERLLGGHGEPCPNWSDWRHASFKPQRYPEEDLFQIEPLFNTAPLPERGNLPESVAEVIDIREADFGDLRTAIIKVAIGKSLRAGTGLYERASQ